MLKALQFFETTKIESNAREMCDFLLDQVDCYGARWYYNKTDKHYSVQAFFELPPELTQDTMPDGCRIVLVPDGMWQQLKPGKLARKEGTA